MYQMVEGVLGRGCWGEGVGEGGQNDSGRESNVGGGGIGGGEQNDSGRESNVGGGGMGGGRE